VKPSNARYWRFAEADSVPAESPVLALVAASDRARMAADRRGGRHGFGYARRTPAMIAAQQDPMEAIAYEGH
jgi:hypothetical protein